MIGIAYTEHNRYDVFKKSYLEMLKYLPKDAMLIVVDDASKKPFTEANFRFENNVGIAKAKNKCLEILYLAGCEHIFLFDSDTYPLKNGWEIPYLSAGQPHLNYIFQDFSKGSKLNDTQLLYKDEKIVAYSHVRGCMMYYHRSVLDRVGGMDDIFGKWGYEHPNLSDRIFNAGMTKFRYMDVLNSSGLIHSLDEHRAVKTTVAGSERTKCILRNKDIYENMLYLDNYVPFIEKRNVFLTVYFTGIKDSQRGSNWDADVTQISALAKSLKETQLVVLHDCFDKVKMNKVKFERVPTYLNPYIQRWISYRDYLIQNRHNIKNVFCIDATDVEILKEPDWDMIGNFIYCGDEQDVTGCNWIVKNHSTPPLKDFLDQYKDVQLLNAGILGGSVEYVIEFTTKLVDFWSMNTNIGLTDMALFNYIARVHFSERIRTGRQVCTVFKAFEKDNKVSWFKHK